MRNIILLLMILIMFQSIIIAQEEKELKKEYKNTVRFNATNPVIFGGKSIVFGYERLLKNNQAFSINIGQAGFPKLRYKDSDSLKANSNLEEKGFHISADFRFYLSKQNKYAPPRGVYIGPYYSFNYLERKNSWIIKSTEGGNPQNVGSVTNFAATTIGFELGYQFVFWDRISLDMILVGPGIGFYKLETSLDANLSEEDKKKFYETLNQALTEKYPGYSLMIENSEFIKEGNVSTTAFGFRYMVMVGFRF